MIRAAQILRYYGNEGDRAAGEVFSSPRRGERILVTRKPLGVVGVVTPFNFPIAIPAWKIAPALVYGNTVVWKPAGTVPLLAMRLAEALDAAGLPAGVLNLLIGPGALGNRLVEHPALDGLTFTGSTGVGRASPRRPPAAACRCRRRWAARTPPSCSPMRTSTWPSSRCCFGAFRSTGQKCTATSRLIVAEPSPTSSSNGSAARLDSWRVGDPTDPRSRWARWSPRPPPGRHPRRQSNRTRAGRAPRHGGADAEKYEPGRCRPQGASLPRPCWRSAGPSAANTAWRDEILWSGARRAPRRRPEEAFDLANDSEFGLSAALFTQDITRALDAVEDLDVGHPARELRIRRGGPARSVRRGEEVRLRAQGTGRCGEGILHPHHHGLSEADGNRCELTPPSTPSGTYS